MSTADVPREGAEIVSADGTAVGRVRRIHRDPETGEIISVVAHIGEVETTDLDIPIDVAAEIRPDRLQLIVTDQEIQAWIPPGTKPTI